MSIAEKLTTIAENQQRVFDAGRNSSGGGGGGGYDEGYSNGYDSGYNEGYDSGYWGGYDEGQTAEYDRFWDAFQQNGNRVNYVGAFSYYMWTDETYNPKYPIAPTAYNGILNLFFWNTGVTDTKVPITATQNCQSAFGYCYLKRIPKLIFSGVTNTTNMFQDCTKLEELYCEGEISLDLSLAQSTLLNKASITSIVNTLSTTASGKTLTLSKTAVTSAFGSTTASAWTTLVNSKSNWTISLV